LGTKEVKRRRFRIHGRTGNPETSSEGRILDQVRLYYKTADADTEPGEGKRYRGAEEKELGWVISDKNIIYRGRILGEGTISVQGRGGLHLSPGHGVGKRGP